MIKDIPLNIRPRERFLESTGSSLSNEELLAIVLKTGTKGLSSKDLAIKILTKYQTLNNLKTANYSELTKIKGIGKVKAIELLTIFEICKRINQEEISKKHLIINSPEIVYELMKEEIGNELQEYFYCLYLDSSKKLIKKKMLFKGTLNQSLVHPREIFKEAYLLSAASIICVHNHPSGSVIPSKEDFLLTENLVKIGKMLSIPVNDHVIVTQENYYSFYENHDIL